MLVERHYPAFVAALGTRGRTLPAYVHDEFAAYLKCGRLEHGFLRVRCTTCHAERLVAYSCKRRGFCPSCAARRMTESAALLVDEVLPREPVRQWVLSVPFPLRYLFATDPVAMGAVLGIAYRAIAAHLVRKAGLTQARARTVTPVVQIEPNAWTTVGLAALDETPADHAKQIPVIASTSTLRTLQPLVEAARRDLQHLAHHPHRPEPAMLRYEPKRHRGCLAK